MWRTCKNRNEQVNILADLNVKTKDEVLDKLRELECDMRGVRTKKKTGGGAPKKPAETPEATEKAAPERRTMDVCALTEVLERVCDGYAGDKVRISAGGAEICGAVVSVVYDSAGAVEEVNLELLTE